jgi:hypothetical protein
MLIHTCCTTATALRSMFTIICMEIC